MRAGKHIIGEPGAPCFIIAEIGVNHNGSEDLARAHVDAVSKCGASAIKFQTFEPRLLVSETAPMADYQKENVTNASSQMEMLEKLTLPREAFRRIFEYCRSKGITCFSTPFDVPSVEFLNSLGVDLFKVGSGDLTNGLLLDAIAKTGKPVIISTGMSTIEEIENAVACLKQSGATDDRIGILHCVSSYPAAFEDLHLSNIEYLNNHFGGKYPIGFSDHSEGIVAAPLSVCCGAKIIEKHFTLSTELEGPDHKASIDTAPFKAMVEGIRAAEQAVGNRGKQVLVREKNVKSVARRSLYIARPVAAGAVLTQDDLIALRPEVGIHPIRFREFIGRKTTRALAVNELFAEDMVQ
jgi:sialic acid synthase SpsE